MTIGERIVDRLNSLGMSQAELARRAGVAQPTINNLINRNKVGSKYLHKIARELQTTPAYLSGETDDPTSVAPDYHLTGAEVQLLEKLRSLSEEDHAMIIHLTRKLASNSSGD